jgi:ABC-type lipoprotein export system ATPase subunit
MKIDLSLLRVENVSRVYPDGDVVALRDMNLAIGPGECIAILGKSGSGKSSLIHILGGCDDPTSGTVYWRGTPIRSQEEWRKLRASSIGIIFQEFLLLPALTAIENVEMALFGKGLSAHQRRTRSAELLERVGLGARQNHLPSALSGGERQRVAIARSVANEPDLLLADEPTGNLDSANSESIVDLLLEIQQSHGTALVIVTHDESIARRCARQILIKDGAIVRDRLTATASESDIESEPTGCSPACALDPALPPE